MDRTIQRGLKQLGSFGQGEDSLWDRYSAFGEGWQGDVGGSGDRAKRANRGDRAIKDALSIIQGFAMDSRGDRMV